MTLWLKLIKNDDTCMKKKKDVIIWEIKYLEHLVSCCLPWWRDCHSQWAILPVFGSQGWIPGLFWSQQRHARDSGQTVHRGWLEHRGRVHDLCLLASACDWGPHWHGSWMGWSTTGGCGPWASPSRSPASCPGHWRKGQICFPLLCWARHFDCPKNFYQHWRTNKMGSESFHWWVHSCMMESVKEVHWIKGILYLFLHNSFVNHCL